MIKEINKLQKDATDETCNVKFEKYKKLRNEIDRRLQKDRAKFYQKNPSISAVWKNANDYLNTAKRSFSNTPDMIKYNGKLVTSPREVANALNETFLKKVRYLRRNSKSTSNPSTSKIS